MLIPGSAADPNGRALPLEATDGAGRLGDFAPPGGSSESSGVLPCDRGGPRGVARPDRGGRSRGEESPLSRVDVIIPCYRYGRYLRGCVESVLGQPVEDLRVLIIDDASPDHTAEVAEGLVAEDRRVEFRRHRVNHGHIATYNEGLEWASGDYLLVLSADDMLTPGALGRAARLMDAHPEVGLAYGRQILFQGDQPPEIRAVAAEGRWQVLSGAEFLEEVCRSATNLVPTPTAVVRTRLQKALGGYRADLPHSGDFEMWLRFAAHASVGVLDADQAFYRVHGSNMKLEYQGILGLQQFRAALETLFRDYGDRLADPGRLRSLAMRGMAEAAFWWASREFDRGRSANCQDVLDFALSADPTLRSWPPWSRLRWRCLLGPAIWCRLRPLVESVRRASPAGSAP